MLLPLKQVPLAPVKLTGHFHRLQLGGCQEVPFGQGKEVKILKGKGYHPAKVGELRLLQ